MPPRSQQGGKSDLDGKAVKQFKQFKPFKQLLIVNMLTVSR